MTGNGVVVTGGYGPEELVGAARWFRGRPASFVTGVVVLFDGGVSTFSGV